MSNKLDKRNKEKIKSLLMSGDKGSINQALTLLDAFGMGTQEADSALIREVTEYLYENGDYTNDYLERTRTLRKEMVRFKGGVVRDLVDLVDSLVDSCWSSDRKLTGSPSHREKDQYGYHEELWFMYSTEGDHDYVHNDDNWIVAYNFLNCIRDKLTRSGLIQKSDADSAVYGNYKRDGFSLQITLDLTKINFNKLKLATRSATMSNKLTKRQASRKLDELYGQLANTKRQANEKYNYYFEVEVPHGKVRNERDMAKWLMANDMYNIEDAIFDYTDDYYSDMQGEIIIKSIKVRDMEVDFSDNVDAFYGTADITWTFNGTMSNTKFDENRRRYASTKMTPKQASKKLDALYAKVADKNGMDSRYTPKFGKSARFSEGEKGRKEFEAWKEEQPAEFQEEWDANTEEYGDKFKQARKMTPKQASRALDRLHAKTLGKGRKASRKMTRKQASQKLDRLHSKLTNRKSTTRRRR